MAMVARGRTGGSVGQGGAAASGLRVLALFLGVFLIFEGLGKLAWFGDSAILGGVLQGWLKDAPPATRWYLETVAIPGAPMFARLVPIGELAAGTALVLGFWSRLAAAAAFLMVLNFHVASGAIFQYRFLTNGFGLPVLGGLFALVIGGARLPWSARG
jgi:uncharacterized membrane protein YphA (DoxX/SURF4 family)